jgi:phytoene dehydrogenase-like protein
VHCLAYSSGNRKRWTQHLVNRDFRTAGAFFNLRNLPLLFTLIAVVPVGHMNEHEDYTWEALITQARQVVVRRLALLGITDLERHIEFETCFTPLSWRKRYNLVRGATHGLCHNVMQLGYFRPGNRHPRAQPCVFTSV